MTLAEASRLVLDRKVSPVELTRECLRRIEQLDAKLNAFITVTGESALAEAWTAEQDIAAGKLRGPLHGIPIALKDLIDTAGVPTTAASALFRDRIPTKDADVVRGLKAAGAIILGKLNLHEFAYGGTSAVSHFGPVRNPWNPDYSPGGSSGGSAAAVAAGMCFGAIGTDTGGSVREPAAYCGIVGLKPTYGAVSAEGVIPLSQYLDHVGPMARTVEDVRLMLAAVSDAPLAGAGIDVRRLRVGIPRDFFYEGLDLEVNPAVETALSALTAASQIEVPPLAPDEDPTYASMMDPYTTLLRYEAYAYHREYVRSYPESYQPATRKRILSGKDVAEAEYVAARARLDELRTRSAQYFQNVDLIVTPTSPIVPLRIDQLSDPDAARAIELQMLRNTRPFNALGLPSISVPCGFTKNGLPIGLQITGPANGEAQVLALAQAYEQATDWHVRISALA